MKMQQLKCKKVNVVFKQRYRKGKLNIIVNYSEDKMLSFGVHICDGCVGNKSNKNDMCKDNGWHESHLGPLDRNK